MALVKFLSSVLVNLQLGGEWRLADCRRDAITHHAPSALPSTHRNVQPTAR